MQYFVKYSIGVMSLKKKKYNNVLSISSEVGTYTVEVNLNVCLAGLICPCETCRLERKTVFISGWHLDDLQLRSSQC